MKIGSLVLDNPTILAPLAGITNLPFRLLTKASGCALVYSEMISANGLIRQSQKTLQMLDTISEEKPLSVQLFGAEPSIMADAAKVVEASNADAVDINFGCPVKKVIKTGAGVALMKSPEKAELIITAVRKSIPLPLTIKIRTGWDKSGQDALMLAEIAEKCGVDAIAVHPRTASQGFAGTADWSIISKIKKTVSIPVIGNGDIIRAEDAVEMIRTTGCDGVMIGRAAIGNPWIFSQVSAMLKGDKAPGVDLDMRFKGMEQFLQLSIKYLGEKRACLMMRSRLGWFAKGLPYSSKFRDSLKQIASEEEALDRLTAYRKILKHLSICNLLVV